LVEQQAQQGELQGADAAHEAIEAIHKVGEVNQGGKADHRQQNGDHLAHQTQGGQPGLGEGPKPGHRQASAE
jgi:hypothetical protein